MSGCALALKALAHGLRKQEELGASPGAAKASYRVARERRPGEALEDGDA